LISARIELRDLNIPIHNLVLIIFFGRLELSKQAQGGPPVSRNTLSASDQAKNKKKVSYKNILSPHILHLVRYKRYDFIRQV
jgi:hypothetical protein